MRRSGGWAALVGVAAIATTGCASTSPRPAFRDAASLVEARTGRREGITSYDDPGWYPHPAGTEAKKVSP